MSPEVYNRLSEADREVLFAASEEAGVLVTKLTNEQLEIVYDELAKHMTIVTEPELRLDLIRAELEGLFDDWDGVRWPQGMLEIFQSK